MTPHRQHVEIEAKFNLPESGDLPDLGAVAGVATVVSTGTQQLTATYFDTADLRLARARVTLRRRTGGADPGWHLKLPWRDNRLEVQRPLGKVSVVPHDLRTLVRALVRDNGLAPVVRLRTTRLVHHLVDAHGVVLAEVAQDTVQAQSLRRSSGTAAATAWQELEVELVEGDTAFLARVGKTLRHAGARPARAPSKLARALTELDLAPAQAVSGHDAVPADPDGSVTVGQVALAHLRGQVDELVARDPQVRLDMADSVHRMRVATRRLRSALATFRPLFDPQLGQHLRVELAWLGGVLGAARDAEVMRDLLAAQVTAMPTDQVVGPVAERISTELTAAYRSAHTQVVAELDGARYLELLQALDAFTTDPHPSALAGEPAPEQAHTLVRHTLRRLHRALTAAEAEPDPAARELLTHEVRKAAKRARYAGEAVTAVFGDRAHDFATRMQTVHDTLGAHQDTLLARHHLALLTDRARHAGEDTFTYGILYATTSSGAGDTDTSLRAVHATIAQATKTWPA